MPASQAFLVPGCMLITRTSRRIDEITSLFYAISRCLYSHSFCSLQRSTLHFGCRGGSHLPALACLHQRCCEVAQSSEQSEHSTNGPPTASVVWEQECSTTQVE